MTDFEVLAAADGKPPEWIRLLPLGEVRLSDGRESFLVDAPSLELIVQQFRSRGIDLVMDYEHQSLNGDKAPAAGWIKSLETRSDGLWGRVDWTPQGAEFLRNREYRYFSPVLRLDPETRRPTALLHVGLTNVPAINHLPPLVAKAKNNSTAGRAGKKQEERIMFERMKQLMNLTGEPSEGEILALAEQRFTLADAAAALPEIAAALGLDADADAGTIKGTIVALRQGQGELESFKNRVESLEAERLQEKAQTAVDEALKAGKLIPAESAFALEDAKRDLEGFKARMELRPKLVPVGEAFRFSGNPKTPAGLPVDATPDQVLAFKAQNLAKEKGLDLAEAQRQVMRDNPDEARQWHGASTP
jgi:phage I-like protein